MSHFAKINLVEKEGLCKDRVLFIVPWDMLILLCLVKDLSRVLLGTYIQLPSALLFTVRTHVICTCSVHLLSAPGPNFVEQTFGLEVRKSSYSIEANFPSIPPVTEQTCMHVCLPLSKIHAQKLVAFAFLPAKNVPRKFYP